MILRMVEAVDDYVHGRKTAHEFEDWFLPATWDLSNEHGAAGALANEIRLRMAEHDMGHADDDEYKELLLAATAKAPKPAQPRT